MNSRPFRGPLLPQAAEELIDRPEEKPTAEQGRMLELLAILLSRQQSMVDGQRPGWRSDPMTIDL